jgi:hypothetical protein
MLPVQAWVGAISGWVRWVSGRSRVHGDSRADKVFGRGPEHDHLVRSVAVGIGAIVLAMAMAGCGNANERSDGPRKKICGTWIGRATSVLGSGPWYVKASSSRPPAVRAVAGSSPTWVRLDSKCSRGQRATFSARGVIAVDGQVAGHNGRPVAVLVRPVAAGSASVLDPQGQVIARFVVSQSARMTSAGSS